ncbi:MAG: MT-A70 family methyltransferase [Pseudomonadota bacterium]
MTTKRYGVIYADPPWYFKNYSAKGTGRAAISHYDVMSLEDLKSYDVRQYAAKDCALFLWATDPMLPQAISVMEAWGFTYKTVAFNWVKLNKRGAERKVEEDPFFTGLGYWTRANPELCLLGTRGHPRRQAKDVRRLLVSERREHSRKPEEVYGRIERLIDGPYLELFARQTHARWDAIGLEAGTDPGKLDRRQPSSIADETDVSPRVTAHYAAE